MGRRDKGGRYSRAEEGGGVVVDGWMNPQREDVDDERERLK